MNAKTSDSILKPHNLSKEGALELPPIERGITLEDVSFRYEKGEAEILKNIEYHLTKNKGVIRYKNDHYCF